MSEIKGVTWDFAGNRLDEKNALALCNARGFRGGVRLITAASVMTAESQRYVRAWHCNHEHNPDGSHVFDNETGGPVVLSTDRGLFQINDKAHPTSNPKDLFDPRKNVDKALDIYRSRGRSFTAWAAYNSGAYMKYVPKMTAVWLKGAWKQRVPYWE